MSDIPWSTRARLVDQWSDARHFGTLKSALLRWLRLPKEAQAVAMILIDTCWDGKKSLLAADIRELVAEPEFALS